MINGLTDAEFAKAVDVEHSFPDEYLVGKSSNLYMLTASEIAFLKAECALFGLGGSNANAHFQNGITFAMTQAGVDEEDMAAFLATPTATLSGTQEEQFLQIGTQLWISLISCPSEAYSSMRRTGYPPVPTRDGTIANLGLTNGELPSRAIYPISEKLSNTNNVQAAIDAMGGEDDMTVRLWWDTRR
jgi:hypothetical protein